MHLLESYPVIVHNAQACVFVAPCLVRIVNLAQPVGQMAYRSGKSKSGADIAHCDGYAWNQRDKLGKGSYGEVYKGWRESVRERKASRTPTSLLSVSG